MKNKKDMITSWLAGGITIMGLLGGKVFPQTSVQIYIALIITGLGFGLVVSSLMSKKKYY